MTTYGGSPWIDSFPKSRVPSFPRHRGVGESPAVVVGGGLTGCATAYAFAAAGIDVMLLEASRIGHGSSGRASGVIAADPGVSIAGVERALGRRAARGAFQAWRRAALDCAALLRRLDIKCHLEAHPTALVAATPEQAVHLKKEQKNRIELGLEAPLLKPNGLKQEIAVDAVAGIRESESAVVDPYRACLGLAAAGQARGAAIFESSPVKRITFNRRSATVFTAAGSIRTGRVIVATGLPAALFRSLERHLWYHTAYLALTDPIPMKIRRQLGRRTTVLRDSAEPPHVVRWVGDERLLVAGAATLSPPPRQLDRVIRQRTMQLMYELSTIYPDVSGIMPACGWAAEYGRTRDGLPYIGPHRNFPFHLFAFGDSSSSVTGAFLASRILLRHHLEQLDPSDAAFAFTRYER